MNETHIYPDGSQRIGTPPFPKLSPLQEAKGHVDPVETEQPAEEAEETVKRKPGRPKKNAD